MTAPPSIADIEAAAGRLSGVARVTPLLSSPLLDRLAGRRILVKAECLQHTGSFKFRGAWSALTALPEEERARGVLAFSSGNHAQGIAEAARRLGIRAVIVMPSDAPGLKIENTRALGAEVIFHDRETQDREELARQLTEDLGLVLIRPFDDPRVIAGQGTVGIEIAEQAAREGVARADVLVPTGGGGLAAGVALALEARAPGLRVRTVEPEGFDEVARTLATGRPARNRADTGSICDAIVTPQPGTLTLPILARLAGPGLAVTDPEALDAMVQAFARLKLVAEPGGAVALAAALFRSQEIEGETVICVISGGNVDPALFARALALCPVRPA